MEKHVVCQIDELEERNIKTVEINNRRIAVVKSNNKVYAFRDVCPHQLAALSDGVIDGYMMPSEPHTYSYCNDGEVVRCPWHGWAFNLSDGLSIADPEKLRLKTYDVVVENEKVILSI